MMAAEWILFGLVSFFHDVFTAIWIGGLIVNALAFMPAVKSVLGSTPQTKQVMAAFQRRQSAWVYISMAGLIITGLLMSKRNPAFEGLFVFSNPYSMVLSIKHILVLAMIALSLYRSLVLGRGTEPSSPAKEKLNARLMLTNVGLALLVLLCSGFVTALAHP